MENIAAATKVSYSGSLEPLVCLQLDFEPQLTSTPKQRSPATDKSNVSVNEVRKEECDTPVNVFKEHNYSSKKHSKQSRHIGAPSRRLELQKNAVSTITGETTFSSYSVGSFISIKDSIQLRLLLARSRNAKTISQAFMSLPVLKKHIIDDLCLDIGKRPEKMRNKKHGFVSSLMSKNCDALGKLNFNEVVTEIKEYFPELLDILISIMLPKEKRKSALNLGNIIPRLAMIYGIVMQSRYHELSRIQRTVSMCLADNVCDQNVSAINFITNYACIFNVSCVPV